MICVKISGGLGNQLFQYAFGRAISIELEEELYIDVSEYKVDGNIRKFELSNFDLPYKLVSANKIAGALYVRYPSQKHIFASLYNRIFCRINVIKEEPNEFDFFKRVVKGKVNFFDGYWQSDKYFKSVLNKIVDEIELDFSPDINLTVLFKENKTIVIQIRRGDYLIHAKDSFGRDLVLSIDYYRRALLSIEDFQKYKIFIISDEPDRIRQEWVDLPENATICTNNHYLDFWMICNSDIAIISNSSFGWWGAYLNKKVNKKVIVPQYWFGIHEKKWLPVGIYVENWNVIAQDK